MAQLDSELKFVKPTIPDFGHREIPASPAFNINWRRHVVTCGAGPDKRHRPGTPPGSAQRRLRTDLGPVECPGTTPGRAVPGLHPCPCLAVRYRSRRFGRWSRPHEPPTAADTAGGRPLPMKNAFQARWNRRQAFPGFFPHGSGHRPKARDSVGNYVRDSTQIGAPCFMPALKRGPTRGDNHVVV